ncbi:hypothetical protein E4U38_003700 [Claviceps purpurea]|nr:hypothetical protein E4U38_003700 [Claviceps purpurea]KAG6145488.1 hypothetical protein E4U28_001568 [Claviceps purpurea]KAG6170641.1 hypothetical protein E4U11_002131 [Claviceps purpurea]KAG6204428.1 hypothetical protein E4U50_005257 [Claviceps purpurea]
MHQDLEIVSVMPVNHWTIFLEIPSGQSVRIDMNPLGYEDHAYPSFPNVVEDMTKDESVLEDTTKAKPAVQDVIDLINDNGLQEYTFSSESGGCRYWVYTVIGGLPARRSEDLWEAATERRQY